MESYAHVSHEIFCHKAIFAREGMPFEKNKLVVRLASLLFLYIMKPVSMAKLI